MLKRLCKRPAFWSLLVLAASVGWYCRLLDRSTLFPVQFANGKYGYVNADGRVAIAGEWNLGSSFASDGRALVDKDGKWWFIGRDGILGEPLGSDSPMVFDFQYFGGLFVWGSKRGGFSNNFQLLDFWDEEVEQRSEKANKFGLRRNGIIIVSPEWDYLLPPFDTQRLVCVLKNKKCGFIDWSGKIVIPLQWDSAHPFTKVGLASVKKGDRWGFLDRAGTVAIALEWDEVSSFSDNGLAVVCKAKKYGFIDASGKVVIPIEYDDASAFDSHGMAFVAKNSKYGFIDGAGKIVIPLTWDKVSEFDAKKAALPDGVEVIDGNGLARSFQHAQIHFNEIMNSGKPGIDGYARYEMDGKHGIINRKGEIVVPASWDQPLSFDVKKLAKVMKDNKCSFINIEGRLISPLIWDRVGLFGSRSAAWVTREGKTGLMSREGEMIIPTAWESLWPVVRNEEWDPIKKFDPLTPDVIIAEKDKKLGIIDWSGKIIITPEWKEPEVRTDAGSKSYAFIVSRRIEAAAQPGWLTSARDWFNRVIGREESRSVLCHLYDTDGRLLWSSDWLSGEFWLVLAAVPAGLVLAFDGFAIWRRRRRERIAAMTPAAGASK